MTRRDATFPALVLAQAAHSLEEYYGRLYESFPPARFVSGLISQDVERGFIVFNVALVAFGACCVAWVSWRGLQSAVPLAWFWVTIEVVNGAGHPLWSLRMGGYTPGVATAPLLLVLALALARQLRTGLRGAIERRQRCGTIWRRSS